MNEFELSVALLTPASDLVTGDVGAKFEANFGRTGNDSIYAYDPGSSNNLTQNIDFLFGDLFDNSTEEYEIVLNIQNTQQGGNPFLILDRNIPSVGADRFVLGDKNQPYYTSPSPDTLSTTNKLGLNEFAVLYDFSPAQDKIQLNGKPEDYRLVDVNGLQVQGIAQPVSGKAIFSLQQGLPDLVGYVIARPEVKLDLKGNYFQYVGNKPDKKPESKKLGQLGTTGIDRSLGAATDPSGNVYITGVTTGPLQGNNQGYVDAWVAKYGSNGNQLLGKQIGTSGSESAYAVATDKNGNFYLAGDTGGNLFSTKQSSGADAWVAKYDSNGNQLWGKQLGTNVTGGYSNSAFGLDVDDAGNVFLSGIAIKENQRTDIFNFPVQDDSWVTKLDSNGNQQWFTQIGSFFFDENYDLAADKNGNTYTVGWTQGLIGAGGQESDPSRQLLKYDAWMTKTNPNGQIEWTKQFGSVNQGLEFAWGVDTDSQGNIYATGWTTGDLGTDQGKTGSYDVWFTKFTPDGTQQWTKKFGSQGDDAMVLSDMHIDAQDNIFLTGFTNDKLGKGQKDGSYNAWVGKFDTEGNNKWIQQLGSKDNLEHGTDLSTDGTGKLYVTGITDGLLGSNTGANVSATDAWLAQLDVEKGNLQKFIGDVTGFTGVVDPSAIPTVDISNTIVTSERLPAGDNVINPAAGINTTNSTLNYGQLESSLGSIFDPSSQNSFPAALTTAVDNGTIVI